MSSLRSGAQGGHASVRERLVWGGIGAVCGVMVTVAIQCVRVRASAAASAAAADKDAASPAAATSASAAGTASSSRHLVCTIRFEDESHDVVVGRHTRLQDIEEAVRLVARIPDRAVISLKAATGAIVTTSLVPGATYKLLAGPKQLPVLSCKSWGVCDASTGRIIEARGASKRHHPASITKAITCLVVMGVVSSRGPKVLEEEVTISRKAAAVKGGTHADLLERERYSVLDLLYATMLPSGNDAATALAEHFGPEFEPAEDGRVIPDGAHFEAKWTADSPVGRFVAEMNRYCASIGAANTHFSNPHGMSHVDHYTTVEDLLRVAPIFMSFPVLAKVVATTVHTVSGIKGRMRPRRVRWRNTNDLLESSGDLFDGIKTGWIPQPPQRIWGCLLSRARRPTSPDLPPLFVVVIGSENKSLRFVDTQKLAGWAFDTLALKHRAQGGKGQGPRQGSGGGGGGGGGVR